MLFSSDFDHDKRSLRMIHNPDIRNVILSLNRNKKTACSTFKVTEACSSSKGQTCENTLTQISCYIVQERNDSESYKIHVKTSIYYHFGERLCRSNHKIIQRHSLYLVSCILQTVFHEILCFLNLAESGIDKSN